MSVDSYFGKCDRRGRDASKEIVNTVPLWRNTKNTEEVKEELKSFKAREDEGGMTGKVRARFFQRKKKVVDMYESILASDPRGKMSALEKDRAQRVMTSFGRKISEVMPTKTDMQTKDSQKLKPAKLAKIAKIPSIKLDNDDEIREAILSNLKVKNGMVSKDDMVRGFQNIRDILGEEKSVEELRRPGLTEAGRGGFVGYDPKISEKHAEIFGEKTLNNMEDNTPVVEKLVKMWTCDEPGCGEEMTTRQKGMHIARHRKEDKKKARNNQLVTQEA